MGLKGGSGALQGCDGYDHIGMIDASGGVLDQDYEMFEQQTPHRLIKHELLTDSAGAGPVARRPGRGDGVRDRLRRHPARDLRRRRLRRRLRPGRRPRRGAELHPPAYPDGRTVVPRTRT
jgi:N-methylhydantoinase B/oxoprolinase/acetone carboxylase alpha subunit